MKSLRLNNALFWCGNERAFLRMRAVMADPDIWPKTYAEFVRKTNELVETTRKKGVLLTKIDADPDAFIAWCQVKARKPDRRARLVYAGEKLSNQRRIAN